MKKTRQGGDGNRTSRTGGTAGKTAGSTGAPARAKAKKTTLPGWMPDVLRDAPAAPAPSKRRRGSGEAPQGDRPAQPRNTAPRRGPATPGVKDPFAEREALRYEFPIPSREALLAYLSERAEPLSAEQLADAMGLSAPDRFEALCKRLAAMLRAGQLLVNRRGAYAPAAKLDLIAGVVSANPDGYGFLRADTGGDDLFLPPGEMRKALHGDRVLVSVTGMDRRGRREGAIVEVLERRTTRLVGRYAERDGVGLVQPDDRRLSQDVIVPLAERNDARTGQIVVAEITAPPTATRPPFGRILSVLGERLTPSLAVEVAIHGHSLPHHFPPAVLAQAAAVPLDVQPHELDGREDLRALPLVTIDGEDAKDFDDAVYAERVRGGYRLVVAIADVSHYVQPGSPLDAEAQLRGTSVYFPGYVVPMLPETLSNGICSLNPKVERLCFVCDMQVTDTGEVKRSRFYPAVMRSHARLTYTQVWKAAGEQDPDAQAQVGALLPQLDTLMALYRALADARARRGAIEFESGEVRFVLGPAGEVVQAGMLQRNDAHKLIEECMIAANVEAAKLLLKRRIPAPYRVHERPPESKYTDLQEFLAEFKLRMPPWSEVTPGDYTRLIHKVRERPDATLIESVLLRSMSLAVYSPGNVGHFGLALEAYAHFTSPIRRYPDLLLHRALRHALAGGQDTDFLYPPHEMAGLALRASECERRATEAEREVDERLRCAWMEQHVGGEFDGVIAGVTSFGLFVELVDSKVTGLVHVTQLPADYYHFDPVRKTLAGERRGLSFRLGDPARIIVLKASLEERRIDFRLVQDGESTPFGRARKRKAWS